MSHTPASHKKVLLTHLDWNLQRLDEVLKQGETDYFKSAALQRFGHTYAMAIKSIHGFGEPDETKWEEMITDYQCINQNPDNQKTEAVYQKLPDYQQTLQNLYSKLQSLL